MAVKKRIKKGVTPPLHKHPLGQSIIQLTGTQYGTFPVWTPKSARWAVEWIGAHTSGLNGVCGGPAGSLNDFIRVSGPASGDAVVLRLNGLETSKSLSAVDQSVEHHWRIDAYADGWELRVDGVAIGAGKTALPATTLPSFVAVGALGNNSQASAGPFRGIRFIDLSPLQSVRAMAGNGSNIDARFPAFAPGTAFEIEGSVVCPDITSGQENILSGDDGVRNSFVVIDFYYSAGVTLRAWSRTAGVTSSILASQILTPGAHYQFRLLVSAGVATLYLNGVSVAQSSWTLSGAEMLDRLYSRATFGTNLRTALGALKITDLTTGKVWEYNNANDTGNLLVNSSKVDRLGPELFDINQPPTTVNTVSYSVSGNSITLTDPEGGNAFPSLYWIGRGIQVGGLYRVSVTIEAHTNVQGFLGIANQNPSATERAEGVTGGKTTITKVLRPDDTNDRISLFLNKAVSDAGESVTFSNISIRRIYALKTAEGAELSYNLSPRGSTLPSNLSVTADGFTVDWSGYYDAGARATPQLTAGKVYKVFLKVEFLKPFPAGNSVGVVSGGTLLGGIVADGEYTFYRQPTVAEYLEIRSQSTGNTSGAFRVSKLKVVEVTHGIWHQSGAVMTDAAANAARTFLPPISRTYDFRNSIQALPAKSPLQLARVMQGAIASQRHARIPAIPLSGDWKITLNFRAIAPPIANTSIFGEENKVRVQQVVSTGALRVLIGNGSAWVFSYDAIAAPVAGQHYELEIGYTSSSKAVAIKVDGATVHTGVASGSSAALLTPYLNDGKDYASGAYFEAPVAAKIQDLTTGKLYHYANLNDSGNVLENLSKVDRLGPELTGGNLSTFSSSSQFGGDIVLSSEKFTTSAPGQGVIVPLVAGALFEVVISGFSTTTITVNIADGPVPLTGRTELGVGFGTYFVRPTAERSWLYIRNAVAGTTTISNISIRRIYSLATAEPLTGTETNTEAQAKGHGIWYEGATAMTAAAANAARTMLPALPKRLAYGGDVVSVSGQEGVELAGTKTPYFIDADWANNGDGSYTLDTDGLVAMQMNFVNTVEQVGKTYRLRFRLDSISAGGALGVVVSNQKTASTVGYHEFVITPADANGAIAFKRGGGNVPHVITISDISMRETNAVKWTGLTADNIIEGELA